MRAVTRVQFQQWLAAHPDALEQSYTNRSDFRLPNQTGIKASTCAPLGIESIATWELADDQVIPCEHTFGLAHFADQDWLVEGEKEFLRDTTGQHPDLTPCAYFDYCPVQ